MKLTRSNLRAAAAGAVALLVSGVASVASASEADIKLPSLDVVVGSGLNGLSQTSSLQSENNQLEKPYSPENGRDNNQITSEVYEFPIVRRFIFAVFGLLGGFFLSLWGWYLFDKDRRLLGASLVGLGWLLGALGLTLLILTDYPSTWRWIL